jgi:hypothetical protein
MEKLPRKYKLDLEELWDTIKRPKLQIMDIEQGDKIQTKFIDNLFNNIIAENFPKLKKGRDIQVQEAFRTLNCPDQKRNTPSHAIIKL